MENSKGLELAISAVEQNNNDNGGYWAEWSSANAIAEAYEIELNAVDCEYLELFIKYNCCELRTNQSFDVMDSFNIDMTFWKTIEELKEIYSDKWVLSEQLDESLSALIAYIDFDIQDNRNYENYENLNYEDVLHEIAASDNQYSDKDTEQLYNDNKHLFTEYGDATCTAAMSCILYGHTFKHLKNWHDDNITAIQDKLSIADNVDKLVKSENIINDDLLAKIADKNDDIVNLIKSHIIVDRNKLSFDKSNFIDDLVYKIPELN